ncbi:IclR family transcriptional regulator [Thalassobacillus sp. CUG 92003]|uniref:IclR family transcriptional regulator n=1 Tax=Thalassobacillus sp. CUG 92003 TaxID=2736641 RepID=UPI0015E6BE61|nr:IclR family transcriptional regulator [Thalassobacillus sp. CUG 92003]
MKSPAHKDKYLLSSVLNAMQVLQLFKNDKHDLSMAEISHAADLPKSTAHRLISTLTNEGFLSQNPRTGKYRLGLSLLTLGGVISVHKEIYQEAFPLLETLVRKVNETCHLCLLEKERVVYFYRSERKNPEMLVTDIGKKSPMHCTGEGLILLAYQDKSFTEYIFSKELKQYTPYTITDPEALRSTLETIRQKGYAISKEHYFRNFVGIAVPIRDYSSNVVSSLAIIGPTERINEGNYSYYIEALKRAASDISQELGYYGEA